MATTPEVRTIGQLVAAVDLAGRLNGSGHPPQSATAGEQVVEAILLPIFQRFPVWDKQKRRSFIESIHQGLPVGSLLVHREYVTQGQAQLTLIDGLQRMTAIREYVKAPLEYNRYRQVPSQVRGPLEDSLSRAEVDVSRIDPIMDDWFADVKTTDLPAGYRPDRLIRQLAEDLQAPGLLEVPEVDEAAALFLHALEQWVDISEYLMPVLVYEGSEENLARAFELLNSAGTALSKYDIYAAQWATDVTVITNEKIREEARIKYEAWEQAGWTIEMPDNAAAPEGHNLYEYLLGLGRYLTSEFPALFSPSTDLETESTGFILASLVFGLKPTKSQMPGLPNAMPRQGFAIDPGSFETALLDAAEDVDSALRRFLHIRLNSATGRPSFDYAHTELQMASLISAVLVHRFDPVNDWAQRPDWTERKAVLSRNIGQHYVIDILDGAWSGSGDTLAFERVWQTDDDGRSTGVVANHYLQPVSPEQLQGALDSWFERDSFSREQLRRGSIRAVEKLLLRLVYSGILFAAEDLDPAQGFDIEHIYPVKRVADAIGPGERGWPISCLANLMLLDRQLNRRKREMTLAEALEALDDQNRRKEMTQSVERFLLVDLSSIQADGDTHPTSELPNPTRETYEEFLRSRWEQLRARTLAALVG